MRDPVRLRRLIVLRSIVERGGLDADPRVHLSQSQSVEVLRVSSSAEHTLAQCEGTREKLERILKYIYVGHPFCCEETARHSRDGSSALNPNVTATQLRKTDDRLWTARYSISLSRKWRQEKVRRCNSICILLEIRRFRNVNFGMLTSVYDLKHFVISVKVVSLYYVHSTSSSLRNIGYMKRLMRVDNVDFAYMWKEKVHRAFIKATYKNS